MEAGLAKIIFEEFVVEGSTCDAEAVGEGGLAYISFF